MSFDFTTLITDRSKADVDTLSALLSKPLGQWTEEELAAYNGGAMKGGYWWTDLNRVSACMEYLDEQLRSMGYETGYISLFGWTARRSFCRDGSRKGTRSWSILSQTGISTLTA